MDLNPEPYLSEEGKEIFARILKFIKDNDLIEGIDALGLSALAHAFDHHFKSGAEMNTGGLYQTTQSGYSQVKACFVVWQKTGDYINKNADKFGLNPAARDKIKSFSKKGKSAKLTVTGSKLKKYQ